MKRACLLPSLTLLLSTPPTAHAQSGTYGQEALPLKTAIRSVRVHPDEAWITRAGSLRLPAAGTWRLAIADLPPGLAPEDVKASVQGPAGTRLGELVLKSDPLLLKETPAWKQLQEERGPVLARRAQQEARRKAHDAAVKFLDSLVKAHGEGLARRMGSALPPSQAVVDLAALKEQRGAELNREEAELTAEEDALRKEEQRLDAVERMLVNQRQKSPTTALVEISAAKPGLVEVTLSQRTRASAWAPAYEARLSSDRKRLELALLASVKQDTGEPWDGVRLEFATRPAEARLEAPVLGGPTFLHIQEGGSAVSAGGKASAAAVPSRIYRVEGSQVLTSGAEAQRFTLAVLEQAPTLHYLALPRESSEVFLLADLRPTPAFPLFDGAGLQIFVGSQRLGSQRLAVPAAGEGLSLSFGPAPGISAGLNLLQHRHEQVGTFTKERQWTFLERLQVGNGTDAPLQVEVRDRVVRSSTNTVKVDQGTGTTPGWKETLPGVRSWALTVPPRGTESLDLSTQVRAPLEGHLTRLGDLRLEDN